MVDTAGQLQLFEKEVTVRGASNECVKRPDSFQRAGMIIFSKNDKTIIQQSNLQEI